MLIDFLIGRFADLKVFLRNKVSLDVKVRGVLYYLTGLSYEEAALVLNAEIGKVSKIELKKSLGKNLSKSKKND